MSESRQSSSKIPQLLDKQAPDNSETRAGRHERHKRDREAAEADTQGIFAETPDAFSENAAAHTPNLHFSSEQMKTLLADTTRICVSIFMPTHPAGGIPQNMTQFKNLYRSAEQQLVTLGMDASEAAELLVPLQELLSDVAFWQGTSAGLAVFRSPELFRVFCVGQTFEEAVLVNDHFYIQPLLPLLDNEGVYYVLTLSQDDIRLLRGSQEKLEEVPLEGVPRNMADALNEEPERHAFNRQNAFGAGQQFHGHSQANEDTVDRLDRFFHMVDKGLHKYFRNQRAPLVLAGVEYLFAIYRRANTYAHLIPEGVHGNPYPLSLVDLHERSWPVVQPFFLQTQEDALTRYQEAKASPNLTSHALEEIVSAAAFGRVDTLFTAVGTKQYGHFDADANETILHDPQEVGDEELINFAAMQVLQHSGVVHMLPPERMPDNAVIAALYRFESQ